MPYMDESGLSRYDPKLKEWISTQPVKTLPSTLYPWTLSEKAGAVAVWPVGGTPLKPTVDFMFTETGPASGDKSPSNPSTIMGVSQAVVMRGAGNVIEYDEITPSSVFSGIAVGNSDGSVTFNGTIPSVGGFVYRKNGTYADNMNLALAAYSTFLPAGTYKIGLFIESGTFTANSGYCAIRYNTTAKLGSGVYIDNNAYFNASDIISGNTVTMPEGGGWYTYCIVCGATASFSNCTLRPYLYVDGADISGDLVQVNTDYTLPLGDTYYGGSIDLATGVMTVTHTAIKIGDISGFTYRSDFGGCWTPATTLQPGASYTETPVCTHAIFNSGADFSSITDGVFRWGAGGTNKTWWYFKSTATTPEEFYAEYGDAYLAFKIQVPYTVQLDPVQISALAQADKYTPRLNTVYSDQEAVQVGYVKSPIREEYELTQAIVAQGGNI